MTTPTKPGEGPGYFLADLVNDLPDETLRQRWAQGRYGKGTLALRADYAKAYRQFHRSM